MVVQRLFGAFCLLMDLLAALKSSFVFAACLVLASDSRLVAVDCADL